MNKKFVVNIGRQLGSGGKEIGEKLGSPGFGVSISMTRS